MKHAHDRDRDIRITALRRWYGAEGMRDLADVPAYLRDAAGAPNPAGPPPPSARPKPPEALRR